MSLDQDLIVGCVFVTLIALTLLVMLADTLRGVREWSLDASADLLTLWRTRSWRSFRRATLNGLGKFLQALAQRCFETADTPQTLSGAKLTIVCRNEWESKRPAVEAQLIGDHIYVAVPGRVVKFQRSM